MDLRLRPPTFLLVAESICVFRARFALGSEDSLDRILFFRTCDRSACLCESNPNVPSLVVKPFQGRARKATVTSFLPPPPLPPYSPPPPFFHNRCHTIDESGPYSFVRHIQQRDSNLSAIPPGPLEFAELPLSHTVVTLAQVANVARKFQLTNSTLGLPERLPGSRRVPWCVCMAMKPQTTSIHVITGN